MMPKWCCHYYDNNNDNVQVYLVTGGYNSGRLSSTELLLPYANSWSYSAALPSPRNELRSATLNNKVVVIGTNIDTLIIDNFVIMSSCHYVIMSSFHHVSKSLFYKVTKSSFHCFQH